MKKMDFRAQYDKALDLYFGKKWKEAKTLFETLQKAPDITDYQKSDVLRRLGGCYCGLGNTKKAFTLLDQALALVPENDELVRWIFETKATVHAVCDQYEEALKCFYDAIESIQDTNDLEYLEQEVHQLMERYESYKRHGSFKNWKQAILRSILGDMKRVEKERSSKINKK